MAYCRVSYRDIQGIGHSVTVEAESLFEAVAMAVKRFRETLEEGCPPGPACAFRVQMHRDAPVEYTVDLKAISDFAHDKTVRSPKEHDQESAVTGVAGDWGLGSQTES